jgi:single-stranded DNA-binding protein
MSREAHVRFCESAGLRCPALLTFVEGRLRTREWENNRSNGRRTEIVASRVQFLGTPPTERTEANPTDDSALPADSEVPF